MSLVISTAWNAFRHTDAEMMIQEVKDLGFSEVELSFNLTSGMVDLVEALVRRGAITVSSVHNFCPIPEGLKREEALPDFFSMASLDEEERKQSVAWAKKSIDTAGRLNAAAVVIHCGRVEMANLFSEMVSVFETEGSGSPEFRELRAAMIRRRAELSRPHLEAALRSLDELNSYAARRQVLLGVETRYYYNEIPNRDEVRLILDEFKGGMVRYWHDCGHAQVSENLGICSHEEYLAAFKDELLGMHLHDVTGASDHQTPSKGAFDFNRLNPYITKETIKVMEIHRPAPPSDLVLGREFLKRVFDGKA